MRTRACERQRSQHIRLKTKGVSCGRLVVRCHGRDGRATTLTEAILEHGGEAWSSRQRFVHLAPGQKAGLLALLDNLGLFKAEEE